MAEENMNESATSNKGSMTPILIGSIVILAIAVIGGLLFFMGQKNRSSQQTTQVQDISKKESTSESDSQMMQDDGALAVTLEAGSYYFKPNVINAKLGQTVKVTVKSVSQQHDFVIDKLGVKSPMLPAGQDATVEFVADTLGQFEFYCSVSNHKQQGMVGTLIVKQ